MWVQGDTIPSELFLMEDVPTGVKVDHESEVGDDPSGAAEVFDEEGVRGSVRRIGGVAAPNVGRKGGGGEYQYPFIT